MKSLILPSKIRAALSRGAVREAGHIMLEVRFLWSFGAARTPDMSSSMQLRGRQINSSPGSLLRPTV